MSFSRRSIHTYVGSIVLLMGMLGLVLALLTGEYYRQLVLENHRQMLSHFAEQEVETQLAALDRTVMDFALDLQRHPDFRRAFAERDVPELTGRLDSVFHQYFVTADILKLEKIVALDGDLNPVAHSSEGMPIDAPEIGCHDLLLTAKTRRGPERVKPLSRLCGTGGHTLYTVLVPIGGLTVDGYLQVITDPAHWLRQVEKNLAMPIRIVKADGRASYSSPNWPRQRSAGFLMGEVLFRSADGIPALTLRVAGDTRELNEALASTRRMVMSAAGLTTVVVMLLGLAVLRRTTVLPLQRLTGHLRVIREDRSRLHEKIELMANSEVTELAKGFNEMAGELCELHQSLESLAYNDALTGLPNRVLFKDRLEQQMRLAQRHEGGFALFVIDLDRFKEINDTLGHHAGDVLLQQVSKRMRKVLRRSDTIAFTGHTLARLGGDEFSIILPKVCNRSSASRVATKLINVVREEYELEGRLSRIGLSVGIALFPEHGESPEALCRSADQAMYAAKREASGFRFAAAPGTKRKA